MFCLFVSFIIVTFDYIFCFFYNNAKLKDNKKAFNKAINYYQSAVAFCSSFNLKLSNT